PACDLSRSGADAIQWQKVEEAQLVTDKLARQYRMRRRARPDFAPWRRLPLAVAALGAAVAAGPGQARADDYAPYQPRTTYGEVGILDMPSAYMAPDGELSAT